MSDTEHTWAAVEIFGHRKAADAQEDADHAAPAEDPEPAAPVPDWLRSAFMTVDGQCRRLAGKRE